ncbi:hypothetical protein Tco_0729109 [Tanacetum coccineum]|uniref:Uncharacterized protein n=1 Tax=Tanacetum coccineum TaxID=301880 RepID=A0ABQ4YN20_9ASTR
MPLWRTTPGPLVQRAILRCYSVLKTAQGVHLVFNLGTRGAFGSVINHKGAFGWLPPSQGETGFHLYKRQTTSGIEVQQSKEHMTVCLQLVSNDRDVIEKCDRSLVCGNYSRVNEMYKRSVYCEGMSHEASAIRVVT